ncbi:MAG TPA: RagB/SusD family nutrient uptake outer membrane protein [Longimicrobiales bacterium]
MRSRTVLALAAATLLLSACQSLDVKNPNSPTEQSVLTDANGVLALGVGIQQQYAQGYINYLVPDALVTDEWGTKSRSLLSYQTLLTGGPNFDKSFDVVSLPYSTTYRIALTADNISKSAPGVGLSAGTQAGLIALARLIRAMALGNALQLYQQLPVNYVVSGATPQPRAVALDTVIALLEQARAGVASLSDTDLSGLKSRVLGPGFDLKNTIDAMLARYYLIRGSYQQAIDAAARVNQGVLSVLTYPSPTTNPIWNLGINAQYVAGLHSFTTQAQAGDPRPAYWLNTATHPAANPDSALDELKKYSTQNEAIPAYLPAEMLLIQAEGYARLNNTAQALVFLNQERTARSWPIDQPAAGLPALTTADVPTQNALLQVIAYERRYELYGQIVRWEDMRRLPQPWANALSMPWLPIPQSECLSNPNAKPFCT